MYIVEQSKIPGQVRRFESAEEHKAEKMAQSDNGAMGRKRLQNSQTHTRHP